MKEIHATCVLDFFVASSERRKGYGKLLYDAMLIREAIRPEKLAIDRPSEKFLGFMKKHFNLFNYSSKTNNFVIYDEYFLEESRVMTKKSDRESSDIFNTSTYGSKYKQEFLSKRTGRGSEEVVSVYDSSRDTEGIRGRWKPDYRKFY